MSNPKLPRSLMAGGSSVAIVARPLGPGALIAHKPSSQTREVEPGAYRSRTETYYIAACAAGQADPDDAFQVSAAWADHIGAVACTEPACFPHAA